MPITSVQQAPPLGSRLRALREAAGLSMADVVVRSEKAGYCLTCATLSRVERDRVVAKMTTLRAIAAGLGTTIAALVED